MRCRCRQEQTANAMEQRSAAGGEYELHRRAAMLLEIRKRARIRHRVAAQTHGEIVAAVLPLTADTVREPPHNGVVEEQGLEQGLQKIDEIVVPADVRELVRENGFHLQR